MYRTILLVGYASNGALTRTDILEMDHQELEFHKRELVALKRREKQGVPTPGSRSYGRWDPSRYR